MERSHRYKGKRKRSRSSSRDRTDKPRHVKTEPSASQEFSFEQHKQALNKILSYSEAPVSSVDDLWIFIKKYEATLKKAGKPILQPKSRDVKCNSIGVPVEYSKDHCVNFTNPKLKFFDTGDGRKLEESVFRQFVDVVSLYLDFKNKEKFTKFKKLREAQRNLPVAQYRDEIVNAVKKERVVIVAGDTGCGKSTQVPQYLREAGFENIACTQPRRIACISLAKRVAFESLSQFGTEVGYQIRFEKSRTSHTKICFITEGLLLRQMSSESLPAYDVIILDEVHERHLHGDFLLGVLKCLVQGRRDLKLVLMSATINLDLFVQYFSNENPAVIEVPGRLYPIELQYKPILIEGKPTKHDRLDPQPYVQIMQMIDSKYPGEERGDLLVFLSGVKEITAVCSAAQQYADKSKRWIVLPLHSGLSLAEQDKVFDYPPEGVRKCIVSTNIAETSVTIDGIRFVADSGKVKEMSYDPSCKMQRLKEFWISKASAEQRKGRAGRTGPGVCLRVYSEKQYSELEEYSTPEVARVPLASLLLLMASLGMSDVRRFPFLDAPPPESVENAILELKQHGALSSNEKLTALGRVLADLPVEVPLAKALVLGCATLPRRRGDSALALAAVLGVRNVYTTRAHRDIDAENARKPEESEHGDPLCLLSLYCAWLAVKAERRGDSRGWCRRRALEEQRFYEVTALAAQFRALLQDNNLLETIEPESMSSAERSLRHGQMKQLKDMRRQHKIQSAEDSKKKKRLKVDSWELVDENGADDKDSSLDIKDIEFRMTNDAGRIQGLISGTTASSGRDLQTLKLVLCRALYPQIAVADEFNHCKSVSEQLFHTTTKAFVFLHPTSYFGRHPQVLQLAENEIVPAPPGFTSRQPLSSKHQLLCYLSLLETVKPYVVGSMRMPAAQSLLLLAHTVDTDASLTRTPLDTVKPYVVGSMRMPAAQSLLLLAHTVDTDASLTRLVCDSWLLLEFPHPHAGATALLRALGLRRRWDLLIEDRIRDSKPDKSVESELSKKPASGKSQEQLQYELSCDLAAFMTSEVYYTVKRLLPGDLKLLYAGYDATEVHPDVDPNPFCEGFKCFPHERKGGVCVSDNVVYNCLADTQWSYEHHQEMTSTPWTCPACSLSVCLSPLERLQHLHATCASAAPAGADPPAAAPPTTARPNARQYACAGCRLTLHLTPVEILKHRKSCK